VTAMTDPKEVGLLERRLDSFDPLERKEALAALVALAARGEIFLPPPGNETNVHGHTFFSFNAYGYSPTGFAWRARRRGLAVAGIVDFDVLHGLGEIIEAGDALNLRTTGGPESRVFIPELSQKVINSPREPGIYYFMGTAHAYVPPPSTRAGAILERMYRLAQARNREIMERVNRHLGSVVIDYEQDVIPLTPSRNPTERHLLVAYDRKARAILGERASGFWAQALRLPEEQLAPLMADVPRFHEVMRAKLMKFGAPGYVPPEAGAFPRLDEAIAMVRDAGGLPTATWLDGTSEGEAALGELLDFLVEVGIVVVNIIPDRNWNIPELDERKRKVENLVACMAACRRRELPVIAGTEMNKFGQPFVDNFHAPELAPFVEDFAAGALLLHGHTVAARHGTWTYSSAWAEAHFGSAARAEGRKARNEFYRSLGERGPLAPARRESLSRLRAASTPREILAAAGPPARNGETRTK
jgi:hypothetical protein